VPEMNGGEGLNFGLKIGKIVKICVMGLAISIVLVYDIAYDQSKNIYNYSQDPMND
jgi:hypothetical protein